MAPEGWLGLIEGPKDQVLLRMGVLRNVGMGSKEARGQWGAPDLGTVFSPTKGQDT